MRSRRILTSCELSIRGRDQANRTFGIVPPAIGVRVFFASLV